MVTPKDLAHRRWFVSQGLNGHLPEESIRAAVRLCEEEFSRDPAFSLVKFLDRLGAVDRNVAEMRPALFVSLQKARLKPLNETLAEPRRPVAVPSMSSVSSYTPPPTAALTSTGPAGWHDVFNITMSVIFARLKQIKGLTASEAAQHLLEEMQGQALSPSTAEEVNRCLRRQEMTFTARVTKREMHVILHSLYLWACEALGPVITDKLFSSALEEANKHPAAANHPPLSLM